MVFGGQKFKGKEYDGIIENFLVDEKGIITRIMIK